MSKDSIDSKKEWEEGMPSSSGGTPVKEQDSTLLITDKAAQVTIGDKGHGLHGSPEFYGLLKEMAELHSRKSYDYASNENPYGNYHFAGLLASLFAHSHQDAGFIGRLGEKFYRLANLEKSGKTPSNESIEDTEKDICVIVVLWMADRRARRAV